MICDRFIYVDLGRTGGSIVRNLLHQKMEGRLAWLDARAHLPLSHDRRLSTATLPSFSFIRNPFDWYVSYYLRDLKIHRWRGAFRDWMFERKPKVTRWMAAEWEWMGGPEVDHVGRFETLLEDIVGIFGQVMSDRVTEQEIRAWFPECAAWSYGCSWMEGAEQWLRDQLYDGEMVERVYQEDAALFDRFGYTFEEKYYFFGGCGASCHPGYEVGNWEGERELSTGWAQWQVPG